MENDNSPAPPPPARPPNPPPVRIVIAIAIAIAIIRAIAIRVSRFGRPNMRLLYAHYRVGIYHIPQPSGQNAIQWASHCNKTVLREHFGVNKFRGGGDEPSRTHAVLRYRFSMFVQWESDDVDRTAPGFVDNADDLSAPDDDFAARAYRVGPNLVQGDYLGLLPKIFCNRIRMAARKHHHQREQQSARQVFSCKTRITPRLPRR